MEAINLPPRNVKCGERFERHFRDQIPLGENRVDHRLNGQTARMEPLSFRRPSEILAMEFDDADFILRNGYLTKGEPSAIFGAGSIGKSRLVSQLVRDIVTGRKFLGRWETTPGNGIRALLLQTENTCRRLKADLCAQMSVLTPEEKQRFDEQCTFHTLENSDDSFLTLVDAENQQRVADAISAFKPDLIVWDVLRDFAVDDPNSDRDMQATLSIIGRLTRKHNPACIPLILHHARTGRAGAASATGIDRGSFGRNSKVLFGWVRAQINVAPYEENENNTLIIASGKCNNAQEFKPFAVSLDIPTMSYELDELITPEDIEAWHGQMAGGNSAGKAKREKSPKEIKAAIMGLVPDFGTRKKADVEGAARAAGTPRAKARDFLAALIVEGELFEWEIKCYRGHEIHLAKSPQPKA